MVLLSTMTSSDMGVLMGTVQWSEEGSYVKEIATKGHLPQLAKAIKGQYLNVGVPSLANPSLASSMLLFSGGKILRVAAQCVKFKEGRRVVPVGPKIAIPENYEGFFEILSEDGRAVRCIETVSELSKRFPDSCLVREPMKAFVSRSEEVADIITEKSRSVHVGETLVLVGEAVGGNKNGKAQQRFLRCFDQAGQNVFLPFESKGKFSAIAKEDNISGVHSIKNLLNKRLPLMVRLIHGKPPVGPKVSQFQPELRLFAAFKEESLAALPLGKEAPLILLPPSAHLKLTLPKNQEAIEKTKEFNRLRDRSTSLLKEISEKIYVYDVNVGTKSNNGSKDPRFFRLPEQSKSRSKHSHPHRSQKLKTPPDKKILNTDAKASPRKVDDYDEIDEIYDYVRGFAPLPKHIKSPYASEPSSKRMSIASKSSKIIDTRPVPPPIETIPSRKKSSINEKLSPSVHPALISAALEKAERKVVDKIEIKKVSVEPKRLDYKKLDKVDKLDYKKLDKGDKKLDRKVEKRLHNSSSCEEKRHSLTQATLNILSPMPNKNGSESKGSNKLFIKASQQKSTKSRIFRHKSNSPIKDAIMDIVSNGPHLGLVPSLSMNHVPSQGGVNSSPSGGGSSPSPLFKMRYKSLTNLVMDFDTLDSSTSKNSTDSCGSVAHRNKLPEKRSRRLPRPKSLTNLVFDGRGSNLNNENNNGYMGNGNARALLEAERKLRLEPGVYRHHIRDAPALIAATSRMLANQKKIGTLYL